VVPSACGVVLNGRGTGERQGALTQDGRGALNRMCVTAYGRAGPYPDSM